ncbi:type I polyketide synthase [Aspergillus stella-maris]|uniref:type I polyketide synthase n=1 Tax=Aspergillus stella-maris TaxID=1810926 RepID=UPI003CCDD9B7
MKVIFFSNKFPIEDPSELFRSIRRKAQSAQHVILRQLLEEATTAVRDEIRLLPSELRAVVPPFNSILDLTDSWDWHRGPLSGTFECVFLCLASLCHFAGDYETRPHAFNFTKENSVFTGLGLGFLAATAIVASPSLSDVPRTAAEVIRIAMRTGIVLYQRSQDLEPQSLDSPPQSWTTLVKGLGEETVQGALDRFNESSGTSGPGKIYISVVEPDGNVFINGPPSKMRQLFNTPGIIQSTPRAPLPVYGGPCHAAHLYDRSHVSWIVQHVQSDIAQRDCSDAAHLLSMADGQPLVAQTALELFESATNVLLTKIIRWVNVITGLSRGIQQDKDSIESLVESCGSSVAVDDIVRMLQEDDPDRTPGKNDLTQWLTRKTNTPPSDEGTEKIAIVGMSCRLPGGADDLERFWELLEDGRDVHQTVPANRYNVQTHTDPTGRRNNTSNTPFGCFIDSPDLFDSGFFDMSPREAAQTDPTHRLALLTAYEALEHSGYVPGRTLSTTKDTVGTVYGECSDDYREANAGQDIDMYFIPGNYRAFAPGRINYLFKFSGPSYSCDTACSASLVAVQIACSTLSRGEANMVVAGGLNVLTSSDSFAGLSRAYFLSKTGGCKVFDDGADGYCRADGVGSLVLKRLSDAQKDNDNILGVILASGTNHSSAAVSITHPHAPTQERLYRNVLRQAGVAPSDVDLIEMHGTGTQAGDAAEMTSVTNVFSPSRRKEKMYISSVKANVGHGEAAAGITALMKALLIFQHNAIPKHVGIKTRLNSKFPDLEKMNVHIPQETVQWPTRPDRKRYIMVNNFSAAGGNTAVLLEEPPERPKTSLEVPGMNFVVATSAKSSLSLHRNIGKLIEFLQEHSTSIDPGSLAYTTTARRIHHQHRIAVHGTSIPEITRKLEQRLVNTVDVGNHRNTARSSMAFVFSGQGSFYTGIGRDLIEQYPPFAREIDRLDHLCLLHGFPSILPSLRSHPSSEVTPLEAQLTTVCVQIALTQLWRYLGVRPHVVIGASLGEYAALHAAGALSANDTIYLVGQRALLMQELCTANSHTMLAVQATKDEIQESVPDRSLYEVSCINANRSISIAGLRKNITTVKAALDSHGYRSTELNVPYAFHSSQMDPILERFAEITHKVTFRPLQSSFISPLLEDVLDATRGTVRFSDALQKAHNLGLVTAQTAFLEIGIHQTYSNAVRSTIPDLSIVVPSLRSDQNNWHTLASTMTTLHEAGPFESSLRLLDLPRYQWNLKSHWIQYNGDWLLTKDKAIVNSNTGEGTRGVPAPPGLRTPLLHRIIDEDFWTDGGKVFYGVASGHRMCGNPVASVYSYPDMALSIARYMFTRIKPGTDLPAIDFGNVQVIEGLIPRKDRSKPQHVQIQIETPSWRKSKGAMQVSINRVADYDNSTLEELATGTISFGNPINWLSEWEGIAHLIMSRIKALNDLVREGRANRLTQEVVYTLFKNVVEYSTPYRGIQSVVVHGLEAVADLILQPTEPGRWPAAPPHHIDSIAHVSGFVLNAGTAPEVDTANTVYVMEGWKSMRFGKTLVPGRLYRSYVRMGPVKDNSGSFSGDVYVLDSDEVVGMIAEVKLRPLPRILMRRLFDSTPSGQPKSHSLDPAHKPLDTLAMGSRTDTQDTSDSTPSTPAISRSSASTPPSPDLPIAKPLGPEAPTAVRTGAASSQKKQDVLVLIASETGIDMADIHDETHISELGIDSLLSLVLLEKLALEFDLRLPGSFFLDFPTVGAVMGELDS